MSKKFYAVKCGYKPGIFETWDECKKQVSGYKGAVYKSFKTYIEAEKFIEGGKNIEENFTKDVNFTSDSVIAYVDGSYNISTSEFSYGMVIIVGENEHYFSEKFSDESLCKMRNVAGEIMGSRKAIEYALENGFKNIIIYYDYEGIEKWCTGEWETKKEGTQNYKKFYDSIKNKINVIFKKVKSHSGDKYNDMADNLAKKILDL